MKAQAVSILLTAGFLLSVPAPPVHGEELDRNLRAAFSEIFEEPDVLEKVSGTNGPVIYRVLKSGEVAGYGVVTIPVGMSGPFRTLVAATPECSVKAVKILNYPHRRGRGVRKRSFLKQFEGARHGKPLELGEQIDGVSGATVSAEALTRSVRRALLLSEKYCRSDTPVSEK